MLTSLDVVRRRVHAGARRRRAPPRPTWRASTASSARSREASIPALATLGDALDVGRPALENSRPLIQKLGHVRRGRRTRCRRSSTRSPKSLDETGAHRARDGLHLLPDDGRQRLRRHLALPARRPHHQPLPVVLDRARHRLLGQLHVDPLDPGGRQRASATRRSSSCRRRSRRYTRLFDASTGKPVDEQTEQRRGSRRRGARHPATTRSPRSSATAASTASGRDLDKSGRQSSETPEARLLDYMLGSDEQ